MEHTIWPLGRVVVLCNIMILILWTIIEPPKYCMYGLTISMVQRRSVHVILFNGHSENPFLSLLLSVLPALMVSVMAYKTRNMPDELSGGRRIWHISLSHYNFFLIFGTLYWFGRFIP